MKKKSFLKGFTIIEVLAATAIISISMVAMLQSISMVTLRDSELNRDTAAARIMYADADRFARLPGAQFLPPTALPMSRSVVTNAVTATYTRYTLTYMYTNAVGVARSVPIAVYK